MAFSMDLRRRVAAMHKKTGSSAETGKHFQVSESWVRRLLQVQRATDSLEPRSSARKTDQRSYKGEEEAKIRDFVREKPDATLVEIAEHVGKAASVSTVWRTLRRLNLVRKKSPSTPPSRIAPTSLKSVKSGTSSSRTARPPT